MVSTAEQEQQFEQRLGDIHDQLSYGVKRQLVLTRYPIVKELYTYMKMDPLGFDEYVKSRSFSEDIEGYAKKVLGVNTYKRNLKGFEGINAGYSQLLDIIIIQLDPDARDQYFLLGLKLLHELIHAYDAHIYDSTFRIQPNLEFSEDMAFAAVELLTDQPNATRSDWTNAVGSYTSHYSEYMINLE